MNHFLFGLLCIQALVYQNAHSQAIAPSMTPGIGGAWGSSLGGGMGWPGAQNCPGYGGAGQGEVGVCGELPVCGNTVVSGQVPTLGNVQFTGNVPAVGTVTIVGNCACGCAGQRGFGI